MEMSVAAAIIAGMGNEISPSLGEAAHFQAGVITRQQALRAGLSRSAITSKLKHGRWQPIYLGVYATFTGPVSREAQLWAAVLYAGKGAQLSHQTAAELNGLTDRRSSLIHVTIPPIRRVIAPKGVKIHMSAHIDAGARFPRGVIPHTLVEETILDLVNAAETLDDVIAWVTSAFGRRLTAEGPLRRTLSARGKLRWRGQLGEVVAAAAGGAHSLLEFRYDRDVERAHGLPSARRQVPFTKPDGGRGFRDRYYAQHGLVVELDGKQAHPEHQRGRDRRRDNDAIADGGSTLRYDWDEVTRHACATAAQVAESLRKRGWTGRLRPCSPGCLAAANAA
jgi:very-short-patch-repair endonuclease